MGSKNNLWQDQMSMNPATNRHLEYMPQILDKVSLILNRYKKEYSESQSICHKLC